MRRRASARRRACLYYPAAAASATTVTLRPSTATTRTRAPFGMGAGAARLPVLTVNERLAGGRADRRRAPRPAAADEARRAELQRPLARARRSSRP